MEVRSTKKFCSKHHKQIWCSVHIQNARNWQNEKSIKFCKTTSFQFAVGFMYWLYPQVTFCTVTALSSLFVQIRDVPNGTKYDILCSKMIFFRAKNDLKTRLGEQYFPCCLELYPHGNSSQGAYRFDWWNNTGSRKMAFYLNFLRQKIPCNKHGWCEKFRHQKILGHPFRTP